MNLTDLSGDVHGSCYLRMKLLEPIGPEPLPAMVRISCALSSS